jgi:hypothetical protein
VTNFFSIGVGLKKTDERLTIEQKNVLRQNEDAYADQSEIRFECNNEAPLLKNEKKKHNFSTQMPLYFTFVLHFKKKTFGLDISDVHA